jgi:deoxyribodipyrimidine photo-lyase
MKTVGLYWLTTDLRLHDNRNWMNACCQVDELLCVYCVDPAWLEPNRYGLNLMSANRWRFLKESLLSLDKQLQQLGQHLLVVYQHPIDAITRLASEFDVSVIYHSRQVGFYERQLGLLLKKRLPGVRFDDCDTRTLFKTEQLPFSLANCPASFTEFRHQVEHLPIDEPLPAPKSLPASPIQKQNWLFEFPAYVGLSSEWNHLQAFFGSETAGLAQVEDYFADAHPSRYKETRNALDGWHNSTKISPWLASGSLSARLVLSRLKTYEQSAGANESTYWIFFELLWREYFQWYAVCHGRRLFAFKGIKHSKPLTSFYAERFQRWCKGDTPVVSSTNWDWIGDTVRRILSNNCWIMMWRPTGGIGNTLLALAPIHAVSDILISKNKPANTIRIMCLSSNGAAISIPRLSIR